MNKEKLDRIKECIIKIKNSLYHEEVYEEICDLVEYVPDLIKLYEKQEKQLK